MRPQRLYVNVDHVATVREARRTDEPSPFDAAMAAESGGADGITIHLREDRRHIQDSDVVAIAAGVTTVCNLELAVREDIVTLACELKPYQVTVVPERRDELTTEGGLDLLGRRDPALRASLRRLDEAGIHVALFIDPDLAAIDAAKDLGIPAVELHTGRYAGTWRDGTAALDELRRAAAHAADLGLSVHAGHGLTYDNVVAVAGIEEIEELNIGHSIVSASIFTGMKAATARMRALMAASRR